MAILPGVEILLQLNPAANMRAGQVLPFLREYEEYNILSFSSTKGGTKDKNLPQPNISHLPQS